MYPDRDTLSNWYGPLGIHYRRNQSMAESGVTEGAKNTASFLFHVNEHNNTNTKPQAKKQRFLKSSQKRNSS